MSEEAADFVHDSALAWFMEGLRAHEAALKNLRDFVQCMDAGQGG